MLFNVSAFAGTGSLGVADGPAAAATFSNPDAITVSPTGIVYVTETTFNGIRKIEGGVVSTLASRQEGYADGPLTTNALFNQPSGIVCDRKGNLYVADSLNHRIRRIDLAGNVSTVAGPGKQTGSGTLLPSSDPDQGWADGGQIGSLFNYPTGISLDIAEANLYVSEYHRVRRIPVAPAPSADYIEMVTTVAAVGIAGFADGSAVLAQFKEPLDLALSQTGDIYIADSGNYRIRKVLPSGLVTTVAGDGVPAVPSDESQFSDDRPALSARFELAYGLAVDGDGLVWIADGTHIQVYSPTTNTVSTARNANDRQPIKFNTASAIAILNGQLYVTDLGANKIFLLARA